MTSTPVLALPNFTKPFVIECDASRSVIGAVLMREEGPLAFLSKALTRRILALCTYEKEMIAILQVLTKWIPYLVGRKFRIVTDYRS